MKRQIVGGAVLFASACGSDGDVAKPDAVAADTGQVVAGDVVDNDVSAGDAADDTGAAGDVVAADVSTDASSGDVTTVDTNAPPQDATLADATDDGGTTADVPTLADTTAADTAVADTAVADTTTSLDAIGPDVPPSGDTSMPMDACSKPTEADAKKMLGTPCPPSMGGVAAVCDSNNEILIWCQGSVWETYAGGPPCQCIKTQCGPDQASCIAIGFIGVAASGEGMLTGTRVRLYAA